MTDDCCVPLRSSTLSDDEAVELADLLKAMADPVRIKLMNIIANAGEGCACDFPELIGKSQPTISHHLTKLVNAGLLRREQRGKWAWFRIEESRLAELRSALT